MLPFWDVIRVSSWDASYGDEQGCFTLKKKENTTCT